MGRIPLPDAPLLMFFYGTLMRGRRNHEAFCGGALGFARATVRGSLYDLPQGYPALLVPEEDVRLVGTHDSASDAAAARSHPAPEIPSTGSPAVFGELAIFDDPEARLPYLDGLEGFDPHDPAASPYRCVLIPIRTLDGPTLAWAYAAKEAHGTHLPEGRWPG